MVQSLKQLIVVSAIAIAVFYFAKPLALQFSDENNFVRRRNTWFLLTVAGFLAPSFWLYTLVALGALLWQRGKDSNPIALYLLLLHVIPPYSLQIPTPANFEIFRLDNYRILSFGILIPAAWRLRTLKSSESSFRKLMVVDFLLLAFGVLQIALFIPPDLPNHELLHDSVTNVLRRAVLFLIDVFVLHYAVSRTCVTQRAICEAIAYFCLASAIMAMVGVFETARHWLMYEDIFGKWLDGPWEGFYLLRGNSLRAQASAGPALALGFLLAVAVGLWLAIQPQVPSKRSRIIVLVVLCAGLLASYSRGPWLGAVIAFLLYVAVAPRGLSRIIKGSLPVLIAAALVLLSPLGNRIISVIPFFGGTIDNYNVIYRQRLAARAWELISQSPLFGDQMALFHMDDLRQGQGLIDLVNSFASIALFYGLVGLFFFVGYIFIASLRAYGRARSMAAMDSKAAAVGFSLVATICSMLLMLYSMSFIYGCAQMFYILGAFALGYAFQAKSPSPPSASTAAVASAAAPRRSSAWDPR